MVYVLKRLDGVLSDCFIWFRMNTQVFHFTTQTSEPWGTLYIRQLWGHIFLGGRRYLKSILSQVAEPFRKRILKFPSHDLGKADNTNLELRKN